MTTPLSTPDDATSHLAASEEDLTPLSKGLWNKTMWTGLGVLYGTPHTHLNKALRWAIACSLYLSAPSATLVVVPEGKYPDSPFLHHPCLIPIVTLHDPDLTTEYHAAFFGAFGEHPHTQHKNVTLYVTTNQAALPLVTQVIDALQDLLISWPDSTWHPLPTTFPLPTSDPKLQDPRFRFLTPKRLIPLLANADTPHAPNPALPPATPLNLRPLPPPRWETSSHVYTDGSCTKIGKNSVCGTGVYVTKTQRGYTINPAGQNLTNTINRAELAGILSALRDIIPPTEPVTILSDSLCSLLQVHKHMLNPRAHMFHRHKYLIQAICTCLEERASQGTPTALHKVKGHSGIKGNDAADALAAKAAAHPNNTDFNLRDINATPYQNIYWPHVGDQPLSDLQGSIRTHAREHDPRPVHAVYHNAWRNVECELLPNTRQYIYKPSVSPSSRNAALRFWYGALFNATLAARFKHKGPGRAPPAKCPICPCKIDSAGHMVGACQHPEITGLRISRHNDIALMMARALSSSTDPLIANADVYVDAGKGSRSLSRYKGDRVPHSMIPHVPDADRLRMRPDIMILSYARNNVTELDEASPDRLDALKKHATIYIVEIGCCTDTRYYDTYNEKLVQHSNLVQALQEAGWKVIAVKPLIFGQGGCQYINTRKAMTDELHIPPDLTHTLLQRTQLMNIKRLVQIITTRRKLERETSASPVNSFPRHTHRDNG